MPTIERHGLCLQHDARVINSLPLVAVPTLVLVGEKDRPFPAAADYMAAEIPGAAKAVISGAGHASNIGRAEQFNAAVAGWLARIG